jgi:hypothetical protein
MTTDKPSHRCPARLTSPVSPGQTVRQVLELVREAREKQTQASPPRSPNQDDPERWSAEWRAWTASHPKRDITLDDDRESIYAGCGE